MARVAGWGPCISSPKDAYCIYVQCHFVYLALRTCLYDTRFPSGTCVGEWRKNDLKTIQHVILYYTHRVIQIWHYLVKISAYYCFTYGRVKQKSLFELHLLFVDKTYSCIVSYLSRHVDACLCCGAHGKEGLNSTKPRTADKKKVWKHARVTHPAHTRMTHGIQQYSVPG